MIVINLKDIIGFIMIIIAIIFCIGLYIKEKLDERRRRKQCKIKKK